MPTDLAALAAAAHKALDKLPPAQRATAQKALVELAAKVEAMAGRELRTAKKRRYRKS